MAHEGITNPYNPWQQRRASARYQSALYLPVMCERSGESPSQDPGAREEAHVVDFSTGGLRLLTGSEWTHGDRRALLIEIPDDELVTLFRAEACVRWSKQTANPELWETGVAFEAPGSAEVRDFVHELQLLRDRF